MENFKTDDFEIAIKMDDPILISWIGESGFSNPSSVLNPYIEEMAENFIGKTTIVDFSNLKYMNSSTVATIIHLCKLFNEKKIQTRIVYSKNLDWQAVSFKALEALSQLMENINVEGITA